MVFFFAVPVEFFVGFFSTLGGDMIVVVWWMVVFFKSYGIYGLVVGGTCYYLLLGSDVVLIPIVG